MRRDDANVKTLALSLLMTDVKWQFLAKKKMSRHTVVTCDDSRMALIISKRFIIVKTNLKLK